MEVDSPTVAPGASSSSQPPAATVVAAAAPAAVATVQLVISDSGSSTEVEEDEDGDGGQTAARVPPRPPPTWAFSQRAVGSVGGGEPVNSSGPDGPIRRRIRLANTMCCWARCGSDAPEVTVCLCVLQAGSQGALPQSNCSALQRLPGLLASSPGRQRGTAGVGQHHRGQRL